MPSVLYVGLQDGNKIAVFAIDDAGTLGKQSEVPVEGPSVMAVGRTGRTLYVGLRAGPAITAFRIDPKTGDLRVTGTSAQKHAPTFLAVDRAGRFMLVAYYQGGGAAVFRLAGDGTVGAPSQEWLATATGAHAIATDRSNRFAYVPHIARVQDNVLEPPKNIAGPNTIMQFRFDAERGSLGPNVPPRVRAGGPRRAAPLLFPPHARSRLFLERARLQRHVLPHQPGKRHLAALQTVSTLPAGFDARNTCSQIHLTPSARFLYVGNRGHNSIAGFRVAPETGLLMPAGHAATEPVPSAFCLDPEGKFLFAAGTASGRLASYRIDGETGALTPLAVADVGRALPRLPQSALGIDRDKRVQR